MDVPGSQYTASGPGLSHNRRAPRARGSEGMDLDHRFLPEALARVDQAQFLDEAQRRALNQIRAHSYVGVFSLVEEYVLPLFLRRARPQAGGDPRMARALAGVATNEARHRTLFHHFRAEFERRMGQRFTIIEADDGLARDMLEQDSLALALVVLHLEWMTQRHYLESLRDERELDERFKSLLRCHWLEEVQHAEMDTLVLESLAGGASDADVELAVAGYTRISLMLDEGLRHQARLDVEGFERVTRIELTPEQREFLIGTQHQAGRWTFIGAGMTHPRMLAAVGALSSTARKRLEDIAPAFC